MKRAFLVTVLFLSWLQCKAVDTLVTKLINTAYLDIVDAHAKFYYLLDTSSNLKFDKWDLKEEEIINNGDIPFAEFVANIQLDTAKLYWKEYSLKDARCVDKKHMTKYAVSVRILRYTPYGTTVEAMQKMTDGGVMPVLYKPGMSKRQLKKQEQQAVRKYEDRPIEEKITYYFSRPIFSNDKKFALISLNGGEHGCLYVYKFLNDKWVRVLRFRCWVI